MSAAIEVECANADCSQRIVDANPEPGTNAETVAADAAGWVVEEGLLACSEACAVEACAAHAAMSGTAHSLIATPSAMFDIPLGVDQIVSVLARAEAAGSSFVRFRQVDGTRAAIRSSAVQSVHVIRGGV